MVEVCEKLVAEIPKKPRLLKKISHIEDFYPLLNMTKIGQIMNSGNRAMILYMNTVLIPLIKQLRDIEAEIERKKWDKERKKIEKYQKEISKLVI